MCGSRRRGLAQGAKGLNVTRLSQDSEPGFTIGFLGWRGGGQGNESRMGAAHGVDEAEEINGSFWFWTFNNTVTRRLTSAVGAVCAMGCVSAKPETL